MQDKALDKTILRSEFPQLLHALASLYSAYFQESEEQRDITLKGFFLMQLIFLGGKRDCLGRPLDEDIFAANSESVLNDIMNMIKCLDENHYEAMQDRAEKEMVLDNI